MTKSNLFEEKQSRSHQTSWDSQIMLQSDPTWRRPFHCLCPVLLPIWKQATSLGLIKQYLHQRKQRKGLTFVSAHASSDQVQLINADPGVLWWNHHLLRFHANLHQRIRIDWSLESSGVDCLLLIQFENADRPLWAMQKSELSANLSFLMIFVYTFDAYSHSLAK